MEEKDFYGDFTSLIMKECGARPAFTLVSWEVLTDPSGKDDKTKLSGHFFIFFERPCIEEEEQVTTVRKELSKNLLHPPALGSGLPGSSNPTAPSTGP